jgi:hypothetical protein
MLHKELYLAIAVYNLVRAVICLAAERIQVSPRRLSFTNVFTLLETFLPDLSAATTPAAWNTCWDRIIQLATSYVCPIAPSRAPIHAVSGPKALASPSTWLPSLIKWHCARLRAPRRHGHIDRAFCFQQFHVRMFSVLTDFDRIRVERFKQATGEKLRDVRCPEHRQAPRLRFHGNSMRDISISLSGCCSKLMDLANSRIGAVTQSSALSYARPIILRTPSPNISEGVSRLSTRKASFSKS